MPWYTYAAFIILGVVACYAIIEIRTKKKLKEKKAADRKAAKEATKKSKSAKKKPKSKR